MPLDSRNALGRRRKWFQDGLANPARHRRGPIVPKRRHSCPRWWPELRTHSHESGPIRALGPRGLPRQRQILVRTRRCHHLVLRLDHERRPRLKGGSHDAESPNQSPTSHTQITPEPINTHLLEMPRRGPSTIVLRGFRCTNLLGGANSGNLPKPLLDSTVQINSDLALSRNLHGLESNLGSQLLCLLDGRCRYRSPGDRCARSASRNRSTGHECRRANRRAMSRRTSSPIRVPWPQSASHTPRRTACARPRRPGLRFRGSKRCVLERPFVCSLVLDTWLGWRPGSIGLLPIARILRFCCRSLMDTSEANHPPTHANASRFVNARCDPESGGRSSGSRHARRTRCRTPVA